MNPKQRDELIADLKDYGKWVRQGRTVPNRLGFSSQTQFQPVKPSDYKGFKERKRFDFECRHCQRLYVERTTRPASCGGCGGRRFSKIVSTPLQQSNVKHSTPTRRCRTLVPDRFVDDKRMRRIDDAVARMDWDQRLVVRELYVNQRSLRELAPTLGMKSHNDVVKLQSEALGFLLAELRQRVHTQPDQQELTSA